MLDWNQTARRQRPRHESAGVAGGRQKSPPRRPVGLLRASGHRLHRRDMSRRPSEPARPQPGPALRYSSPDSDDGRRRGGGPWPVASHPGLPAPPASQAVRRGHGLVRRRGRPRPHRRGTPRQRSKVGGFGGGGLGGGGGGSSLPPTGLRGDCRQGHPGPGPEARCPGPWLIRGPARASGSRAQAGPSL